MRHRKATRAFKHIECANEIGLKVCAWIFEAVANAGLRRKMNDNFRTSSIADVAKAGFVFKHRPG